MIIKNNCATWEGFSNNNIINGIIFIILFLGIFVIRFFCLTKKWFFELKKKNFWKKNFGKRNFFYFLKKDIILNFDKISELLVLIIKR